MQDVEGEEGFWGQELWSLRECGITELGLWKTVYCFNLLCDGSSPEGDTLSGLCPRVAAKR